MKAVRSRDRLTPPPRKAINTTRIAIGKLLCSQGLSFQNNLLSWMLFLFIRKSSAGSLPSSSSNDPKAVNLNRDDDDSDVLVANKRHPLTEGDDSLDTDMNQRIEVKTVAQEANRSICLVCVPPLFLAPKVRKRGLLLAIQNIFTLYALYRL